MDISNIIKLIVDNGMYVVLMAYFLLKDWKFNSHNISLLTEIKEVLILLKSRVEDKTDK